MIWPNNKKFAFTIIDDTDNSYVENIKPIYDLLNSLNMRTTKTCWVYPPRDNFTGQSLSDDDYRKFALDFAEKRFELALHNVGSGDFNREEILQGIERFKSYTGVYPKMQINHASNPDNLFWGNERYTTPLKFLINVIYGNKRFYYGTDPNSTHFWGDVSKKHIKYIRNHTFNRINTLSYDPQMPYRVKRKDEFSNYWFSSSDGHTVEEFNNLISPENVSHLVSSGGLCIVYTHFASGFVNDQEKVNPVFEKRLKNLAEMDGWFAPASEILDYLLAQKNRSEFVSNWYQFRLDARWMLDRVLKKVKTGR